MASQQWGSPLLLVPGGRQKGHTSWWSRNSRLLVIYWSSDRVPGTGQPVGEHWRTQFVSWPSAPLLIIYQVHLSGCGTQAVKSHFRHLATAEKKIKKMQKTADASQRTYLLFFCVFFLFGMLVHSYILFHAINFCSSFLLWPPKVSDNELLSRVSAAVIVYKMYNFTVNQI